MKLKFLVIACLPFLAGCFSSDTWIAEAAPGSTEQVIEDGSLNVMNACRNKVTGNSELWLKAANTWIQLQMLKEMRRGGGAEKR